jgi:adenylate cyclase
MPQDAEEIPSVWYEVRRRRIGKAVVAYLAVAFAVVEGVAVLLPLTTAPEWVGRTVLGGVVLGFPLAVVLAWTYDITPAGVVKTPDDFSGDPPPEPTKRAWLVLTVLGIGVGTVLHLFRG